MRGPLLPLIDDVLFRRDAILGVSLDRAALRALIRAHQRGKETSAGGSGCFSAARCGRTRSSTAGRRIYWRRRRDGGRDPAGKQVLNAADY